MNQQLINIKSNRVIFRVIELELHNVTGRVSGQLIRFWPRNFDPKCSTTPSGLESKKAKVPRHKPGSNQLSVKFDWVISVKINHEPQISLGRGLMNFGEWGTLGVSFLCIFLRLSDLRIKRNPGSWKYYINQYFNYISYNRVIFRVIEPKLHNVTGEAKT